jgi:hypothetical protein
MKRAQPGWLVLALAAIAAAIGSFLPFYTFSANIELTVWSRNIFPTATLIPVLVVLIGLEALFVLVMGHEPRSPFLNFTWSQARLAGSCFAIVLALSFLVQGRAGADLGSGYLVVSLSALAALAGAVMTRRSELARGREEIVRAEHPWRAAALRWRRELTAKVEAFAAGANEPRVQPAPVSKDGEKQEDEKPVEKPVDKPVESPKEPTPTPTPVPRLSAVRSEPEADTKSRPAARTRTPSKRPSKKKAASKKTVPKAVEPTLVEVEPEEQKPAAPKTGQRKTEEPKADKPEARPTETPTAEEPTAEKPTADEPTVEVPKTDVESAEPTAALESTEPESTESDTAEQKTADITAEISPAEEGESEQSSETMDDDDAERERPAAPG